MRKAFLAAGLLAVVSPMAWAGAYRDFPAPVAYPFQRSRLTGTLVAIPPYDRPLGVRVFSTPPREPFYNVPPYAVVVPY